MQLVAGLTRSEKKKGIGLLESAYHSFLCHELTLRALEVISQPRLPATYKGFTVDVAYRPDIIVNNTVIVEVKTVTDILLVHRAQVLTYLSESGLRTGLILNFNAMPFSDGIRRISL